MTQTPIIAKRYDTLAITPMAPVLGILLSMMDELLLPSFVFCFLFFFVCFWLLLRLLWLSLVLNIFQEHFYVIVLFYKLFVHILILRHKLLNHVNSIIVAQNTIEGSSAVLRVVWIVNMLTCLEAWTLSICKLLLNKIVKSLTHFKIHCYITRNIAKFVLHERVCLCFGH